MARSGSFEFDLVAAASGDRLGGYGVDEGGYLLVTQMAMLAMFAAWWSDTGAGVRCQSAVYYRTVQNHPELSEGVFDGGGFGAVSCHRGNPALHCAGCDVGNDYLCPSGLADGRPRW